MPISKTDFIRGLQCEKMLWLDAHAPELKIIPPEVQARLDAGNEFGDNAMGIFGEFTETTAYREDGRLNYSQMIADTTRLLTHETPVICEAAFTWYGNFCAADILRKTGDGYAVYEVKNTWRAREEFITDLGFQRLIIRKCGVRITGSYLILRGDTPPEDLPPDACGKTGETITHEAMTYRIVDVTKEARAVEWTASNRVFELGKLKRKDACMPCISIGEQCQKPYPCWYYEHCSATQKER
jgi:hypothetical protein